MNEQDSIVEGSCGALRALMKFLFLLAVNARSSGEK
jgi:hypothetical protein